MSDELKFTGAIRRIDDLGRVVIPKTIRADLGIREGDPLEIYTCCNMVGFKKHNLMSEHDYRKSVTIIKSFLHGPFELYDNDNVNYSDSALNPDSNREVRKHIIQSSLLYPLMTIRYYDGDIHNNDWTQVDMILRTIFDDDF